MKTTSTLFQQCIRGTEDMLKKDVSLQNEGNVDLESIASHSQLAF